MKYYSNARIKAFLAIIIGVVALSFNAVALPLKHYASASQLSCGKWHTVKIKQEGMQFISNQQLRNMGFDNPEKVHVYGYGGKKVSESLSEATYVDDLPLQPSIYNGEGIVFYGVNQVTWETRITDIDQDYRYYPSQNPYSMESVYFLSDRDVENDAIPTRDGRIIKPNSKAKDWFYARVLHEEELMAPSNSGSWILGEDFRTNHTQTFPFKLTGLKGQRAYVCTQFGARATVYTGVTVKGNGIVIANDSIPATVSNEQMFQGKLIRSNCASATEDFNVEITYKPSGVVYLANLDYISVSYPRELKIGSDGYLHFYHKEVVDSITYHFTLSGCTANTRIWDITDSNAPFEVKYVLDGETAIFSSPNGNGREFVAFEPSKIANAPIVGTSIANQDIHAMDAPDMVIITPEEYKTQAERVADLHRNKERMKVYVFTPEALYNEFSSGSPDVSAFRKALKMWYDRGLSEENGKGSKLKHCLIFGRPSYDQRKITEKVKNCGYPRTLSWQNPVRVMGSTNVVINGTTTSIVSATFYVSQNDTYFSDDFITFLNDDIKKDVDVNNDNMSIGVGRFPVRNISDCKQAVDKLVAFYENPGTGFWRNRVMLIADDGNNGEHLTQNEKALRGFLSSPKGADKIYEKLYIDIYPRVMTSTGATFPDAKEKMLKVWDEGVMFTQYIGHANPKEWTAEALFTFTDINSMSNKKLPVWYTATCEFSRIDDDQISGGEIIWANPDAGAIAMLSTSRTVYITHNGYLTDALGKYFFETDEDGNGLPLGTIMMKGKNAAIEDATGNKRRFLVVGDPAMRMPVTRLTVKAESIDGKLPGEDPEDPMLSGKHSKQAANLFRYPVLNARTETKVTGSVVDPDGNCITDFNGKLYYELYDGETVHTTLGGDISSPKMDFNDRRNRLFVGNTEVKNGKWEATIIIPADIQNVTTEPMLVFYAWTSAGVDATGCTKEFYINGWNSDITDFDGPEVKSLVLNSPHFKNGGVVGTKPVAMCEVTDPSGVSIASYGVGHAISLILDGKKIFNDVDQYLNIKDGDIYTANFIYPLPEIDPGLHTLTLNVWDNMGNFSSKDIEFNVAISPKPIIYDVTTDANPARSSVTFTINHDRLQEVTDMRVDVYDLSGMKVWSSKMSTTGNYSDTNSLTWDLTSGGTRVKRGIYLYRATLTTNEGISVSNTHKLAVAAE